MAQRGRTETEGFTGACQCGTIRFRAGPGPARHSVCHCRMCQRATGNAFAPLVEVETARIEWSAPPQVFASSDIAERGFCARCGTPLFYRETGGATTELMLGAIDPPIPFQPAENYGSESRHAFVLTLGSLPDRPTEAPARPITSYQYNAGSDR